MFFGGMDKLLISFNLRTSHSSVTHSFSLLLVVGALLLTVTSQTTRVHAQRSTYSKHYASCSSDRDCDASRTFLRCHEHICQCPLISNFDEEVNRCLIRVGGSCTIGSKNQFCVAYAMCESHSKSSLAGRCKCRSRYHESIDGLCNSAPISSKHISFQRGLLMGLPIAAILLKIVL